MANINFVPDDYIQQVQSRRTNVFYIVLVLIVMLGLISGFGIIKVRQRACAAQETMVDAKIARMQEDIKRFDQLQEKRRDMMKTALVTAELIEPVASSVILASLANELPTGTSLLEVRLSKKEAEQRTEKTSDQKAKSNKQQEQTQISQKTSQTQIDIAGLAPTDLEVAAYIERLSACPLFKTVTLLESKEYSGKQPIPLREFRLRAVMPEDVRLSDEDLLQIRQKAQTSVYEF